MKAKIGQFVELFGFGSVLAGGIAASGRPIVVTLLIVALAALIIGRVCQNPERIRS